MKIMYQYDMRCAMFHEPIILSVDLSKYGGYYVPVAIWKVKII